MSGYVINRATTPQESPYFYVAMVSGTDIVTEVSYYVTESTGCPDPDRSDCAEIPAGGFRQWRASFSDEHGYNHATSTYERHAFPEKHRDDFDYVLDEPGYSLIGSDGEAEKDDEVDALE